MAFGDIIGGLSGLAGLGAGLYGANKNADAIEAAQEAAKKAGQNIMGVDLPDYQAMQLQLEQMKQQGMITPEMENNILQDPTQFNNLIQQDPNLRNADMMALSKLSGIANSGGMDAQAQMATQQALNQTNAAARGAREGNLQNAAQRGVAGSGLEFVSNQMADQNSANSAQMAGLQNAASANQRDLSALGQLSGLTGQMNAQDFQRQAAVAKARDDVNRFNTLSAQDIQRRNTASANQAQAANLGTQQSIANYNTQLANQQQMYNKGLPEQQYNDTLKRSTAAANPLSMQNQATMAGGQASANMYGGLGQGLAGLGASYSNYQNNAPKADVSQGQQYQDENGNWVSY